MPLELHVIIALFFTVHVLALPKPFFLHSRESNSIISTRDVLDIRGGVDSGGTGKRGGVGSGGTGKEGRTEVWVDHGDWVGD
jgi:hypothetical protein